VGLSEAIPKNDVVLFSIFVVVISRNSQQKLKFKFKPKLSPWSLTNAAQLQLQWQQIPSSTQ